jgi:hypothetical protein
MLPQMLRVAVDIARGNRRVRFKPDGVLLAALQAGLSEQPFKTTRQWISASPVTPAPEPLTRVAAWPHVRCAAHQLDCLQLLVSAPRLPDATHLALLRGLRRWTSAPIIS